MLPDGWLDIWVYRAGWGAAGLALVVAVGRLLFQRTIPPTAAFAEKVEQPPPRGWPIALLALMLGSAMAYALFRVHTPFLISGDEYMRAHYGYLWSRTLFLAPSDHIWLAGQFYILGAVSRLFQNLMFAVSVTSLLGSLLTVLGAALLAKRVWASSGAGIAAGVLTAGHWIMLWASANPLAEVFFFPALLFAMERWLAAWQEPADTPESLARRDKALFLAALLTGLGTMFRFEMWYAGVLLGIVLSIRLLRMIVKGESARRAFGCFVACAVIAAYPVAWMVSSWIYLGSPLAFARDAAAMNEATNLFYDTGSAWSKLLTYPEALWDDHWMWLSLPAGGLVLAFFPDRWRRALPMILTTLTIFLFAMAVTSQSGIGSNTRARYTMFILLPLLVIGAGPLGVLWESVRSRARWLVRLAVIAVLALSVYASAVKAVEYYPNAFAVNPDWLEIITRLERENDRSRESLGYTRLHPPGERLYFWAGPRENNDRGHVEYMMLLYHSHSPRQFYYLGREDSLFDRLENARYNSRFFLRKPLPEWDFPERARLVEDLGEFEVWLVE